MKIERIGPRAERNVNWKGGISEYPNHYQMKKNRLEVLKKANYLCQICSKKATEIHHKDFSKNNHSKENLLPVCHSCNHKMSKLYNSKFRALYGKSLKEMAIEMNSSMGRMSRLFHQNKFPLLPLSVINYEI